MNLPPTVKILLKLGAREAMNLSHPELDVEHLLIAVLKLEDVQHDLSSFGLNEKELFLAQKEIELILQFLAQRKIICKPTRHRLRSMLQQEESHPRGEFSGHRTPRCRQAFQEAEIYAQQQGAQEINIPSLLQNCILLTNPTIREIFLGVQNKEKDEQAKADEKINEAQDIFTQYGRDLSLLAREGKLNPVIGREDEIQQPLCVLSQSLRANPLLLGEAGVGKTAIVEGLAQQAIQPDAPLALRPLRFVELSLGSMLAGAKYRGEFEERLKEILTEAQKDPNLVLFIDEIHTILGAGASKGSLDAANLLKPALARGEIRCIGATTNEEYQRYIEKDPALARRFQTIVIEPPNRAESIEILKGLCPRLEKHHQILIPTEVLPQFVDWVLRYVKSGYMPDKAITLLDEACARRRLIYVTYSTGDAPSKLRLEDLAATLAARSNIPLEIILQSDQKRLLKIEDYLNQRVIGQSEAVAALGRLVRADRVGLHNPQRPNVLLFSGPSGSGKTELAKALAAFLYHDEKSIIRLDMSEYQEEHTISKLIGSPPGYIGYGEEPYFIREVRAHPSSVILLDEVEKAHPRVLTIFLQIFDEGWVTSSQGKQINLSEAIFIMTSNLGSRAKPSANEQSEIAHAKEAITAFFTPELLNRVQEIILFQPLSREHLASILALFVQEVNQRLSEKDIQLMLAENAIEHILSQCDALDGARHLRNVFERVVYDPLSQAILRNDVQPGARLVCSYQEGEIHITHA